MDEEILKLLTIEKQYLREEKRERLSDIPLRTLGRKRNISTKFDIPFSPWHRKRALIIIIDLIEIYNLTPNKIKTLIEEIQDVENPLPPDRVSKRDPSWYGREYWRIYELLDHIKRIREKQKKTHMKNLGKYVPGILESLYRPPEFDDSGGPMYQKTAKLYTGGVKKYRRKKTKRKKSRKNSKVRSRKNSKVRSRKNSKVRSRKRSRSK